MFYAPKGSPMIGQVYSFGVDGYSFRYIIKEYNGEHLSVHNGTKYDEWSKQMKEDK